MSDVAATASVSMPPTSVAVSAAPVAVTSGGAESATGQVAGSVSVASAQSISGSNYSLNISESQLTYLSETSSASRGISEADQRMMMLILALIQILFGSDDDESKKRNAALGLAAALMQSGGSQQSQQFTYLEYNELQYSESYSEFQASSVQAASYSQGAAAGVDSAAASGGNLNVTG